MRFKFGPKLSAPVIRPAVAGEKQDPEVGVTIDHFEPGDPGLVHVHLAVSVAPGDPATTTTLMAVHAIAFGPTDGLPSDPQKALQTANPQGSVVASGQANGATLALPLKNVPEGPATILTVLVFDDDPPAATAPATAPASDPAPVANTPAAEPGPVATPAS